MEDTLKEAYKQAMQNISKENNITCKDIFAELENKEDLTSQDIGIISMLNLFNFIRVNKNIELIAISDKLEAKYLAKRENLTKKERQVFDGYRWLNFWLSNTYYSSLAFIQQRTGKYNYLMGRVRDIYFTETIEDFFNNDNKDPKANQETKKEKQRKYDLYYKPLSLCRYTAEIETYKRNRENVVEARESTYKSFKYLVGYNKLMELIADFYNIPDIKIFMYADLKYLPGEYETYNKWVAMIYKFIGTEVIDKETIEKKQKLFSELFKEIPTNFEIPKEIIDKVKSQLSMEDFSIFYDKEKDITHLMCFSL